MCRFASIVLTKDSEHWLEGIDSHEQIITQAGLHADGARGPNVLRVEITPPEGNPRAPLADWRYLVDQDLRPEWHDPYRDEERARAALSRRAEAERWYVEATGNVVSVGYAGTATAGDSGTATAGDSGTATAGYRGTATAGESGIATAGDRGTATAGHRGTATAGDEGTATAGDSGTATAGYAGIVTAGDRGIATAGDRGTATAGHRGTATAGDEGTATAGYRGTATAGVGGILVVKWFDGQSSRLAIGYIGEDGLAPGVAYRVESGKFVAVEQQP